MGKIIKDAFVNKKPIPIEDLDKQHFDKISLAEVLIEYQLLEFQTKKEMLEDYYRLPVIERCNTGKSLLIKVSEITERNGNLIIHGKAKLPSGESWNLLEAPPISLAEDSFVVITPLKDGFKHQLTKYQDPKSIQYSLLGMIQAFDEESGNISISILHRRGMKDYKFVVQNGAWVRKKKTKSSNGEKLKLELYYSKKQNHEPTIIEEGTYIVIDEALDDIVMSRAFDVLFKISKNNYVNFIYEKLNLLYNLENITEEYIPILERDVDVDYVNHIEEFIQLVDSCRPKEKQLNKKQREFVRDVNHFLVTLQGPPGTGKTSGAVAPAVLSRAYASIKENKSATIFVTGVSHRAVNETLMKIATLIEELGIDILKNNVTLYRLVNSNEQKNKILNELTKKLPEDAIKLIKFKNYNKGKGLDAVFSKELKESTNTSNPKVTIIFGTPSALWITHKKRGQHKKLADLIVIDEGSMMDLPVFFLVTSLIKEEGQVMLVGDHRQMQPIQQHDWESEDRETIEEHTPFLSAINFVRFLRDELSESERTSFKYILYRIPPKWKPEDLKKDFLPIHRLECTYRLPQVSADMHTDLFYAQDNIVLQSPRRGPSREFKMMIERTVVRPETLRKILDPNFPIVLIIHDEDKSTRVNELEKNIVLYLIGSLPNESGINTGVVVPFRAQRARLNSVLKARKVKNVEVDTVERFQGGERDVIIISLTASDPAYITSIFRFLFDPNRLNVAMSRMREKLIIVASKEVFTATPKTLEEFEIVTPWKKLYIKMKEYGERVYSGSIAELLGDSMTSKFNRYSCEIFRINKWPLPEDLKRSHDSCETK